MLYINKFTLAGNVHNLSTFTIGDGSEMTVFNLKYCIPGSSKVNFFRCASYDKTSNIFKNHVRESENVLIEGYVNSYRDENGLDRFCFVVTYVHFIGNKDLREKEI